MVRTKADSSCVKGKYTTMGFHIPFAESRCSFAIVASTVM
jgi:hypothetical protein